MRWQALLVGTLIAGGAATRLRRGCAGFRQRQVPRPRGAAGHRLALPACDRRRKAQDRQHGGVAGRHRFPPARRHPRRDRPRRPRRRLHEAEAALQSGFQGDVGTESISGYSCYRTVEETYATMDALASAHPNLARVIDIGPSWLRSRDASTGYRMRVLRLNNTATDAVTHQQTEHGRAGLDPCARIHAGRSTDALRRMAGGRLRHRQRGHLAAGQLPLPSRPAGESGWPQEGRVRPVLAQERRQPQWRVQHQCLRRRPESQLPVPLARRARRFQQRSVRRQLPRAAAHLRTGNRQRAALRRRHRGQHRRLPRRRVAGSTRRRGDEPCPHRLPRHVHRPAQRRTDGAVAVVHTSATPPERHGAAHAGPTTGLVQRLLASTVDRLVRRRRHYHRHGVRPARRAQLHPGDGRQRSSRSCRDVRKQHPAAATSPRCVTPRATCIAPYAYPARTGHDGNRHLARARESQVRPSWSRPRSTTARFNQSQRVPSRCRPSRRHAPI